MTCKTLVDKDEEYIVALFSVRLGVTDQPSRDDV